MDELGYDAACKLKVLEEYRAALKANPNSDQAGISAAENALAQASSLYSQLQEKPETAIFRLADIDAIVNDLFDDYPELQRRLHHYRGTAQICPDKPEAVPDLKTSLQEIENVLIQTDHRPRGGSTPTPDVSKNESERADEK